MRRGQDVFATRVERAEDNTVGGVSVKKADNYFIIYFWIEDEACVFGGVVVGFSNPNAFAFELVDDGDIDQNAYFAIWVFVDLLDDTDLEAIDTGEHTACGQGLSVAVGLEVHFSGQTEFDLCQPLRIFYCMADFGYVALACEAFALAEEFDCFADYGCICAVEGDSTTNAGEGAALPNGISPRFEGFG